VKRGDAYREHTDRDGRRLRVVVTVIAEDDYPDTQELANLARVGADYTAGMIDPPPYT